MDFQVANKWVYGGVLTDKEQADGFSTSVQAPVKKNDPINDPIPAINKENTRAGIHLMHHQIFNLNGLAIILYCRNSFCPGTETIKGVVSCIKFVATQSIGNGSYASAVSREDIDKRICFEVNLKDAVELYLLIAGETPRFRLDVIKPNTPKKSLLLNRNDKGISVSLRRNNLKIDIALSLADSIEIQCMIISLVKIKYYWISDHLIHNMIINQEMNSPIINKKERLCSDAKTLDDTPDKNTPEFIFGFNESPITEGQKKALWAIGINKWPPRCESTIQEMQKKIGGQAADLIIKAANRGDFLLFDKAHVLVKANEF